MIHTVGKTKVDTVAIDDDHALDIWKMKGVLDLSKDV